MIYVNFQIKVFMVKLKLNYNKFFKSQRQQFVPQKPEIKSINLFFVRPQPSEAKTCKTIHYKKVYIFTNIIYICHEKATNFSDVYSL